MTKFWSVTLGIVSWCAIVAYLVTAMRLCEREQSAVSVRDIRVVVRDSARQQIITPAMVELWFERAGMNLRNKPVSQVNTRKIREEVLRHAYVDQVDAHTDINGVIHITLSQRHPVARVNTDEGYAFYVTEDGWILPLQAHHTVYVPVITGSFALPFPKGYIGRWENFVDKDEKNKDKSYIFFSKLINFVRFIGGNEFWNSQIVQINVSSGAASNLQEPKVEIVPRAGNHIVSLGALDDVEQKLDKLLLFYKKALDYQGWDAVRYIDLSYRNQIVCKK